MHLVDLGVAGRGEASLFLVSRFQDPPTTDPPTTNHPSTTQVTQRTTTPPEDDNGWVVPVAIGAGCVLGAIVIVVVAVFIYRKYACFGLIRRKFELAKPVSSKRSSFASTIGSIGGSSKLFAASKAELRSYKKYVRRLTQLAETVGRLKENENRGFSQEFQALKQLTSSNNNFGGTANTLVAMQRGNVLKNRFSNILAYDHSRVVLNAVTDDVVDASANGNGDYINANYLSGFQFEREFIATQGPLESTVTDFWRMCWDSRASAIVMLTKCYEAKLEKCHPYWPTERGSRTCGPITVRLDKQTAFQCSNWSHVWLLSELSMERDGEEESRPILHFAFLSWPDFGVVDPPEVLLSFVNEFRNRVPYPKVASEVSPIVIHCSAGVGRSGVFVALDSLIQQLDTGGKANEKAEEAEGTERSANIFQLVANMRKERMAMVQTLQQYMLIYESLVALATHTAVPKPVQVSAEEIRLTDWGLTPEDVSEHSEPPL